MLATVVEAVVAEGPDSSMFSRAARIWAGLSAGSAPGSDFRQTWTRAGPPLARPWRMRFETLCEVNGLDTTSFFREALEMAEVAVFVFDATGRLVFINETGEALTGYAADELIGTDPLGRLFGENADAIRQHWLSAAGGNPEDMQAPLQMRGGKERVVRWHIASHLPARNDSAALLVIGVDVTRQCELERHMRNSERLATAGVLAAGLAHEIRNPLNGASLHLSVLERALSRVPNVPAAANEAIAVLRAETKRLSAFVTDFLEVTRPPKLARVKCDLNEIVGGVAAATLGQELDARAITLKVEPFPQPLTAELDRERVKRALINLLHNAVEATRGHGNVTLRVRRVLNRAEIEVEDDGVGIAGPNAPIFEPFYTTKEGGTGLGLSIVQRVVTDHGGEVVYTSRSGRTVFVVSLSLGMSI